MAGGTLVTARGTATAAGAAAMADGMTVAGDTTAASIALVTALGKGNPAEKITPGIHKPRPVPPATESMRYVRRYPEELPPSSPLIENKAG